MTALSSSQVAALTAQILGTEPVRAASKDAAVKRFLKVAAERGLSNPESVLAAPAEAASSILADLLAPGSVSVEALSLAEAEATDAMLADPESFAAAVEMHDEIVSRLAAPADDDFAPPAFLAKNVPAAALAPAVPTSALLALAEAVEAPAAGRDTPGLRRLRENASAKLLADQVKAEQDVAAARAAKERAALEAKAARAPKAKAKAKAEGETVARFRVEPTMKIVNVVPNPKKPGSKAFARFALYVEGQTVAEFSAACVAAGFSEREALADLSWDRRHGFLAIEA